MADAEWLTEHEQLAWRGFLDMQTQVLRRISRQLQRDSGLSDTDYEILVRLTEASDGTLRAIELAAATQWEKSRISHQINRMVERGLVTKESCSNTRHVHISVSKLGRAAIEAAAPLHVAEVRRSLIDALSVDQLDALVDIATTISQHLAETDPQCGEDTLPCPGTPPT